MTQNLLEQFLNAHDYDIRKTRNGRWIDQKCTMDELCFVADCVVVYLQEGGKQPFQSPDALGDYQEAHRDGGEG